MLWYNVRIYQIPNSQNKASIDAFLICLSVFFVSDRCTPAPKTSSMFSLPEAGEDVLAHVESVRTHGGPFNIHFLVVVLDA